VVLLAPRPAPGSAAHGIQDGIGNGEHLT